MAYGYWKLKMERTKAAFSLFFRRFPFGGSYAIAAGLKNVIDFIKQFHFNASDLAYLESLKTHKGEPLFEKGFLDYLKHFSFACDMDAVVEGTPVFPYEPLIIVRGPLLQAQLFESILLNIINFQTLIATKASRICLAAKGDEVIEFGLRRAQGIDGALSATRAAYIGGCHSTSNVLAGKHFGIPVRGTHAHSWIMAFEDEKEAFEAFSSVLPNNCIYLIDTYDTLGGVEKAIEVAKKRKKEGHDILGVRLDSGDLAHLSIEIRKRLDQAGFKKAKIMATNELDEIIIRDLKIQGAKIDLWGVGTHLVTAKGQPALDGVYKLSAIQNKKGKWVSKLKISEQIVKTTNPNILQVRRFMDRDAYFFDMLYAMEESLPKEIEIIHLTDASAKRKVDASLPYKDLLVPIFREGKCLYKSPSLEEIRNYASLEIQHFSPAVLRFLYPEPYFVGLEKSQYLLKMKLIEKMRHMD